MGGTPSAEWARGLIDLGSDRQSGAAEIATRARRWMARAVASGASERQLAEVACRLIMAQPAMAPLYRIANAACLEAGRSAASRKAGRERRSASEVSMEEILPPRRARILTYSWSSTVRSALVRSGNRIARVHCSEARPGLEGVRLARALAREGVSVTLSTDAALMGRLEDVDLVVVGADAFVAGGFANKVGTSALARLARLAGRSFFVLADTEKILPLALAPFFQLPTRAGRDIAREAPGLTVENPYFDCTPYRLVSGVVTEKGRTSIGQLKKEMGSIAVSNALVRALERRRSSARR